VLQKTPYSFDVSLWEIMWPLQIGATLVLARSEGQKDSTYLADLIREQSITVAHFVPSMLSIFLDEPGLTRCATLRYIFCSGEVLSAELQQRCFARLDGDLHNLYGPTEAAIDVTAWACQRGSEARTVPIGSPIYNTQILLLDHHGAFVPHGTAGEISIAGTGLARGYYRRADLTAACFRPHPAGPEPGARVYKTGDLAREWPENTFEYKGRLDHQVKLRGQRIELEEIEIALQRHPGVHSCLVQAQTFAANDQRLVAYLMAASEQRPARQELLGFLRLSLPAYMIPSVFIYLEAWPLLSNGKINRHALPSATAPRARDPHGPARGAVPLAGE
jgi:non-ribosomal peptide synthetase component F